MTAYVSVDDLDSTLARVKDLGGTALVPPTPIPGVGAFALFHDPEGNTLGILSGVGHGDQAEWEGDTPIRAVGLCRESLVSGFSVCRTKQGVDRE